ncbi:MAG: hypothetical protein EXQ71_00635 [Acidimicrobiia bacterium]|nr:hypothetical protein [Acidimicrobiia bacterium]
MSRLADSGISIDLPHRWDGQIRAAGRDFTSRSTTTLAPLDATPTVGSVLHASSFALPAERGDYGSGAVESMGGSDILICLLEHEPEAAATALFRREGLPSVGVADFSPESMQRAMPGMSGFQRFFQVAGRPFCLYVVVGHHVTRGPLVRSAHAVVQTISIVPKS